MLIESSAFKSGQTIPKKYTCQGVDVSPPLAFKNIPAEAATLALIVEDPDAPSGTFVHWLGWNIPATTHELSEGAAPSNQGKNDFKVSRYRGPCPPSGKIHHYYFKLYALDRSLDLPTGSSKVQLENAMQGHILEQAELIGTFQR